MQSKITGGETELMFTARVLNKYDVKFYRCKDTGFIQTEEPYWLADAYSSAITKLDVGMGYRNQQLADRTAKLLVSGFNKNGKFLDYAGGYGLFTRLMRDNGFNFYHTDPYCQNIFAEYFDLNTLPNAERFEMVTAFEVFEHLANPLQDIKTMLGYSYNLLFSTELQPEGISSVEDWSYFSTETGQHVAFYTEAALKAIADKLGYNFYTDGRFLHLFTQTQFDKNPLAPVRDSFLLRKAKKYIAKAERRAGQPESLLMRDWQFIKDKLNGKG
ncbi:class I SAM-dependent methyltransferase [Mucilaginibacter auburnensis]|uniref:Methyltransferase family protein n=1 Tax=Mucilaginibacter auburnensis TaxID=1457233 RepID=A0A2H9VP92_9SPHI|nr:class I SAM-dependent methyltransferase [Mucilaginibacter auburnensis]PJJ80137.1 methyltransferase family protein [Mucilaginibacter auburnensis]